MAIRFDYCRLSEIAKKEFKNLDPTSGDLAITDEDYEKIQQDAAKFKKLNQLIEKNRPTFPYIIRAQNGQTYLMSQKTRCEKAKADCYHFYSKDGSQINSLLVNTNNEVLRPVFAFDFFVITNLCLPSVILFGKCNEHNIFESMKDLDKSIYLNKRYRLLDYSPPTYTKDILKDGRVDNEMFEGLTINIPSFSLSHQGDAVYTIIAGESVFPLEGEKKITLPSNTETFQLRATDTVGNATFLDFQRVNVEDRVYFVQKTPDLELQKKLFRQYLGRLINNGYKIELKEPPISPSGNPLSDLVSEYAVELHSKPGIGRMTIKISIIQMRTLLSSNGEDTILVMDNWLQDNEPDVVTLSKKGSDGLSALLSMNKDLDVEKLAKLESREIPLIFEKGNQDTKIPTEMYMVDFSFSVSTDRNWKRTKYDAGDNFGNISYRTIGGNLQFDNLKINGLMGPLTIDAHFKFKKPEKFIRIPWSDKGEQLFVNQVTDKYGNKINFTEDLTVLQVFPKVQGDKFILSVDLTMFGLGELSQLVKIESRPPVGAVGRNKQYKLYAESRDEAKDIAKEVVKIEQAERDFGFKLGSVVSSIKIISNTDMSSHVSPTNPEIIWLNKKHSATIGLSGYHETIHSIDERLNISGDLKFKALWSKLGKDCPQFFIWIAEGNQFGDEIGGHPFSAENEFLASLLNTKHNKDLKTYLAQSDPRFVKFFIKALEIVEKILKEKVTEGLLAKKAPIFSILAAQLKIAKNIIPEKPLQFRRAAEYK